jgi:parallel beta-helix repeat protein
MKLILFFLLCVSSVKADTLFLNRGQVYPPITVVSGRVYVATGTGANPVVSSFASSVMVSVGSNRWEATVPVKPEIVTVNGVYKSPARQPNTGYYTYESATANSITDNQLTGTWVGAEVWVRKNNWTADKGTVTAQATTKLTYQNMMGDVGPAGWGYFLQNHLSALDQEGEWCYSGGKLTVYSTLQPVIRYSQIANLVTGNGGTFINVDFDGGDVAVNGSNNLISCNIRNIENFGIYGNGSAVRVENTTFTNVGNVAILLANCPSSVITGNTFTNVGLEGRGKSSAITSLEYSCISVDNSSGTVISRNTLSNIGYNGVHFSNGSYTIVNNVIDGYNKVKDDGAGIYTWGNAFPSTIQGNIILNGTGAIATRPDISYIPSYGIYMDDNAANMQIIGNTVAHTASSGIFIHNATNIQIRGNTVYDAGNSTADPASNGQLQFLSNGVSIRGIQIYGNKFVARLGQQWVLKWDTNQNDIPQFGSADSNYYCRPIDDNQIDRNCTNVCLFQTLSQWQTYSTQDIHSKKSPKSITSLDSMRFEYATSTSRTITLSGGTWVDITGKNSTTTTLQPYTSVVLIYKSSMVALGIDPWTAVTNIRQVHNDMYDRFGNYLKIYKNGTILFYANDGKLLRISKVTAGQTSEIPYSTFFIKGILIRN